MQEKLTLVQKLDESLTYVREKIGDRNPEIGIILGSGLGPFAESVERPIYLPFGDVPHMKQSSATSHVGRFVVGEVSGKAVICMQGRLHGYEGYTPQEVAYPVWLMHKLGVERLITTNAAGAINESYSVGDFCIMSDHINFTGRNPIVGIEPDELSFRFFSMQDAYDPEMRKLAKSIADKLGISVQEGVYLGLLGPSFETPAEIRAFRSWGADTVAMSVCEEVIAARHVGIKVLGISLCSNMACGVGDSNPNDTEVLEVAAMKSNDFCRLIKEIVANI